MSTIARPEYINRQLAWELGLYAERFELRGREVWTQDDEEADLTLKGEIAPNLSIDEFLCEFYEGFAK